MREDKQGEPHKPVGEIKVLKNGVISRGIVEDGLVLFKIFFIQRKMARVLLLVLLACRVYKNRITHTCKQCLLVAKYFKGQPPLAKDCFVPPFLQTNDD